RRADEDVGLVPDELEHHLLQFPLAHLAVADDDPRVGYELLNLLGHFKDVVHAVVYEIDLSFAIQLAKDRLANALLIVADHLRDDAAAVLRRGGQAADVAQAEHAHVKRARDWRG